MLSPGIWIVVGLIALVAVLVVTWRPLLARRRQAILRGAQREFRLHREQLEAKFFHLAAQSGKPRGLRWIDCEFDNDVTYARDRSTGEISAFVGVAITFEAIEGGGMEEVEAVGNLKAATAVFHFERGRWSTQGRAIFNLNPSEAIEYYQAKLERIRPQAV